jgi:hypothetical protein
VTLSRSIRARRGVIALALTIWSQACVVHRPMPGDGSLRQGTDVRIRSLAPLDLKRQTDTLSPIPECCTTVVEGRFVRVAGDTIVLERGSGFAVTSDLSRIPVRREILTVVRTPENEVTVRQIDRARTTALVVGITGAVIGLLALGASQIQYGLPSGGGTYFLGAPVIWPR